MPLGLSERVSDGVRVIAVAGELDLETAPLLERLLLQRPADVGSVVIDLTGVGFVDSAGVRLLVAELRRCHGEGAAFTVAAGGEVRRLLELSGVSDHMRVVENVHEAF